MVLVGPAHGHDVPPQGPRYPQVTPLGVQHPRRRPAADERTAGYKPAAGMQQALRGVSSHPQGPLCSTVEVPQRESLDAPSTVARPASSRATGTRNGEHET